MSSQQLDEEAILEVASDIKTPAIRDKYLRQVCHDERLLGRLEGRLRYGRRRWQFSLRTLLVAMVVAAVLFACSAISVRVVQRERNRAAQARQMAVREREHAMKLAEEARRFAEENAARSSQPSAPRGEQP